MASTRNGRSYRPVAAAAAIALLAIATGVFILPALSQDGDYGVETGANAASIQKKNATLTAVAAARTALQQLTVTPTPTPVTPTATPAPPTQTPNPYIIPTDAPTTAPTSRRRG